VSREFRRSPSVELYRPALNRETAPPIDLSRLSAGEWMSLESCTFAESQGIEISESGLWDEGRDGRGRYRSGELESVFPRGGTMSDYNDWNTKIIEEFRSSGGKVGGPFAGAPLLLLTTTGAKSGQKRTTPMMYLTDGDRLAVFASKAGAPTNPDWYHNLVANPRVAVEVGTESFEVEAQVADRAERDRLYAIQAERYPGFAEYEQKTDRVIPVVLLTRVAS